MLDVKWIRENKDKFNNFLLKRSIKVDLEELLKLDEEKRQLITLIQELQKAKNKKNSLIGGVRKTAKQLEETRRDVTHINERLEELNQNLNCCDDKLAQIMDNLPNLLDEDVPQGLGENANKLIKSFKNPDILPDAREHFELGSDLGMMDFEQTAKISGSRFVTLTGDLARLGRALTNYMLDLHCHKFHFEEISPPSLARPEAMYNVGQLPKFSADSYLINNENLRLIPTGEVPLTNMVADKILSKEDLPIRYVSYTECYRSEAGSAGRDTRGMIRNHQFGKVELVTVTTPEESKKEHEYMLNASEEVLKQLDIPYRVMLLCTGDTGFAAGKTYDIEVWLPGQKKYREIASISNCKDFQARRMKARFKELNKENRLVHTLNGSALPIGRTIVAILENYQNPDGSITIPEIIRPYMNGKTKIEKRVVRD